MGKKLSWATMIIIIILSLCVGVGAGMLISNSINKNRIEKDATQEETKQQEEKVIQANTTENKENSISSETKETPKYDGTKSITVNSKEYKVSYIAEEGDKASDTSEDWVSKEIKVYLNDKKVKSFKEFGYTNSPEYNVTLHNLKDEYIAIEFKALYNGRRIY